MNHVYNNKLYKQKRKTLRKSQTDVERLLWSRLRNRQLQGLKFYRQYSIGPYILDFFCPQKNLGIELDGSQHKIDNNQYDTERTLYLKNYGIRILRFWNNDIIRNMEGILESIFNEVTHPNPLLI